MITNWGYTFDESVTSLPDMLTVEEFNTYTGGKYSGETERITAEITAACASIRNFVGWHLYPSEPCEFDTLILDRRITPVGCDLLIQLPARVVSSVTSVTIDGVEYTDFHADQNGLLRVFDVPHQDRRALVEVIYTAGLTDDMAAAIKELIAHRVTHSLAVPSGITSEASGGVSVTYNANWINNSRATALAGNDKELLIPYKVQGVF